MKFCVAYMNFYDNELTQTIVDCGDILDAPVVAGSAGEDDRACWDSVESMQDYFFEGDSLVSVLPLENI